MATSALTRSFEDFPSSLDEDLSSERLGALPGVTQLHRRPTSLSGRWVAPFLATPGICPPPKASFLSSIFFGLFLPLEVGVEEQDKGETEEAGAQSGYKEALGTEFPALRESRTGPGSPDELEAELGPEPRPPTS